MPTPSKPKLLLVDDKPANLLALEAVLGDTEYELVRAASGPEALDLVARLELALVLLDVQMPDMDGFETARRMKALPAAADVPIIFITAIYSEDPYVRKGYESGGGGFADNVVNSALRYRAQAPRVDQLLREIGSDSGDVGKAARGLLERTPAEPGPAPAVVQRQAGE